MASDRQQFRAAAQRRSDLRERGCLGAPDQDGSTVAILMPYASNGGTEVPQDSYDNFAAEAVELTAHVVNMGKIPDVRFPATIEDFRDVLSNPQVSDLIVSGLGNFSAVTVTQPNDRTLAALPSGRTDGQVTWYDLVMMATYLPQGSFTARICGRLNRTMNVPLGFVANDHRRIYAPVGEQIYPVGLDDPDNLLIRQITDTADLGYADIKAQFARQPQLEHPLVDLLPNSAYFALADTARGLARVRDRAMSRHAASMKENRDRDRMVQ